MAKEDIVNRIISDAEAEAAEIIRTAEERAAEIISAANTHAEKERAEAQAEVEERAKRISDGKAAAARLDSAKILLGEKRRVIDTIYARALSKLLALNESDSLQLLQRLLKDNAEEGDEVVLAENFAYAEAFKKLPVIGELKLTVSNERAKICGGCILRGKLCDKDLSFSELLNADMEEYQAEIASKLFS